MKEPDADSALETKSDGVQWFNRNAENTRLTEESRHAEDRPRHQSKNRQTTPIKGSYSI